MGHGKMVWFYGHFGLALVTNSQRVRVLLVISVTWLIVCSVAKHLILSLMWLKSCEVFLKSVIKGFIMCRGKVGWFYGQFYGQFRLSEKHDALF